MNKQLKAQSNFRV